jgi:hypothetical protein
VTLNLGLGFAFIAITDGLLLLLAAGRDVNSSRVIRMYLSAVCSQERKTLRVTEIFFLLFTNLPNLASPTF